MVVKKAWVINDGCIGASYGSYIHMSVTTDEDVKVMFICDHVNIGYLYCQVIF